MPDKLNAPPTGYHEVPAPGGAQSKPPAGYHEVAAPGAPATTASTTQPEQAQPAAGYDFGKRVGAGMGFDVDKVERMETDPSGAKHPLMGGLELARQLLKQAGPWMEKVAMDPFHVADPIHAMASSFTSASGLPDKPGEGFSTPDPAKMLGAGAMILGGSDKLPAGEHITAASKLLERQIALNKGRVGLVNSARNSAHLLENAVTGETGEVGKHAQAVIAADKLDLARSQSEGKVSTVGATKAAQDVMDKTKLGGVAGGYAANMPLDSAKALITQLGREASKLERTGKRPEAAATWAEYDGLRKATQERADALGKDYGRSWKHYIDEFHNYVQLKKGVFGDILEEPNHTSVLTKLTSGDVAAQIPEIKQWYKKYGVPTDSLDYAIKQGQQLAELSKQSSNAFIGKIRAIMKHPVLAGSAAAGAAVAGHATGVPGMGFVLPLIVAGKVAGILDTAQMTKLLREISKKVGPEAERVTPEPAGPQPLPQQPPPGSAAGPATTGGTERRKAQGPYEGPDRRMRTSTGEPLYENTHAEAEKRWEDIQAERAAEVAKSRKAKGKQ
jgi:hypothetical protein